MNTDLFDRLRASLAPGYEFARELGGGGMARVFVASDTRLGRKVVVKVLSPELAEGTSARRFEHEIQIAARTYAWGVLAYECLTNAHRTSAFVVPLRYRSRTV